MQPSRWLLAALCPLLLAPKCVAYEDLGAGALTQSENDSANGAGVPCGEPGVARLRIREKKFNIECGCAESDGKTCTISAGTVVLWNFSDSEEHNIQSKSELFRESGDLLVGTFEETFDEPGEYLYSCSLHSRSMSGYAIHVE